MQVPRDGLEQKLQRLSQSQQSIESVSSFCIFYHKDARGVVQVWETEFYKAPSERKLALLYLANHILQEGRKKGMAFQEEYFKVLPKAIAHMAKHGDEKAKRSLTRMVTVWEERRVFGTRHIKSFKDVLGLPAGDSKPAAGSSGGGSSSAAAVAKLGPVGDALALVLQKASEAAAKGQEFTNSWSQNTLTTAGLSEVTAAHSKLSTYSASLQEEVAARQAALNALNAESARQTAELSRAESQLQAVGGQKQQLESRLALLGSQMTSAMASLGHMFQQNGAAAAAGGAGGAAGDAGGSPQAPDLELDDDEEAPGPAGQLSNPAAAAGGVLGFDPSLLQSAVQQVQQQQQQQQQLQPPQQPVVTHNLQTLLMNPEMLSAAITGSMQGGPAPAVPASGMMQAAAAAPTSMGFGGAPGVVLTVQGGTPVGGAQLQLPTGPVAAVPPVTAVPPPEGMMFAAVPPAPPQMGYAAAGGAAGFGGALMQCGFAGQGQPGGFGGMAALQQQQSGFADEADDPYDPEHAD